MSIIINIGLPGSTKEKAEYIAQVVTTSTGVDVQLDRNAHLQGLTVPAFSITDTPYAIWISNDEPDPSGKIRIFGRNLEAVLRSCYRLSPQGIEFQAMWVCSTPRNQTNIDLDSLCNLVMERRIDEDTRYIISK